jgi:NAD(P)-dependent dehydrogenase (short-subunit alcohol dehydrogenase family)
LDLLVADLSSQRDIHRLAGEVRRLTPRLDVLINNAGVICLSRRLSADGIEMTWAVNHLAPFLLTRLLEDRLASSIPARVVTVASDAHRVGRIDFEDLQGARRYNGWKAYAQSKLANILFTYELARRWQGRGITVNCLHPGAVDTALWRESRGFLRVLLRAARPFFRTPAEGADGIIQLADAPELAEVSGKYFKKGRASRSASASYDASSAARLWEVSEVLAPIAPGSP